jgi:hypothetical protein
MEDFWEIAVPLLAVLGSIVLAIVLLARARERARPDDAEQAQRPYPPSASRRQRKILSQLSPAPEIPSLMDLVRAEIEDLGIRQIPGNEGVASPVLLKVYRRDRPATCTHEDIEYRVADGVTPDAAGEADVVLHCEQCANPPDDDEPGLK